MKDIKGYEGVYAITSCGKVWSYKTQKFLKANKRGKGYLSVSLYKDNKPKSFCIHTLVAETYVENKENLKCVSHLDECLTHNWASNLKWATYEENNNMPLRIEKTRHTTCTKEVYCKELNKVFYSMSEAERLLGISHTAISMCCQGKRQTAGNYHWNYASKKVA